MRAMNEKRHSKVADASVETNEKERRGTRTLFRHIDDSAKVPSLGIGWKMAGIATLAAVTLFVASPKRSDAQEKGKKPLIAAFQPDGKTDISKTTGTDPTTGPDFGPNPLRFTENSNILLLGTKLTRTDLSELGINHFNGKEIDTTANVNGVGWIHYVMNPDWAGILVLIEPKFGDSTGTYVPIGSNDGSKPILSASKFANGIFAVPTDKGVIISCQLGNGYFPLVTEFGVNRLENPKIDITTDASSGKMYVVVSVSNTGKKRRIDLNTGQVEKVIASL